VLLLLEALEELVIVREIEMHPLTALISKDLETILLNRAITAATTTTTIAVPQASSLEKGAMKCRVVDLELIEREKEILEIESTHHLDLQLREVAVEAVEGITLHIAGMVATVRDLEEIMVVVVDMYVVILVQDLLVQLEIEREGIMFCTLITIEAVALVAVGKGTVEKEVVPLARNLRRGREKGKEVGTHLVLIMMNREEMVEVVVEGTALGAETDVDLT
jgi:hypothetical protein